MSPSYRQSWGFIGRNCTSGGTRWNRWRTERDYRQTAGNGSFIKTLKREEIYANHYRDLAHLRANIEEFIEQYYNRCRLHSALGDRPPEEFEQATAREADSTGARMSFFRH